MSRVEVEYISPDDVKKATPDFVKEYLKFKRFIKIMMFFMVCDIAALTFAVYLLARLI